MTLIHRVTFFAISCLVIVSLIGCAGIYGDRKNRYVSSTVAYLYPNQEVAEVPTIPRLSLPLNVGVAFVPDAGGGAGKSGLSEKEKYDLMVRISSEFEKLTFVKNIEIIPSAYLTSGGGFTNLDQIKTMYGIDTIALLSYDQVQHTDEGLLSLSYWTIVGAYIVKGEKNDTSTMVDAAVYDITSRKMLFRAPGVNHIKSSATFVNLSEQLREDSSTGFQLSADDLVTNLQNELERFKAKVKEKPQEYIVEHKKGYTGGSSIGKVFTILVFILGGLALWRERCC
jgi:rhombotail lipoprotein